MPGARPNPIRVFRIVHINNVQFILQHGMFTKSHANADPNYINIGDSSLIAKRQAYPVGVNPPGGNLGDYVPFYFGPLSPMLLNIKTGRSGVTKRPQGEIVYLVCKLGELVKQCGLWCFTNGHAKDSLTDFFNKLADIDEVYWDVVKLRYWSPQDNFLDRQTRKQAEFLVKDFVPPTCIEKIVVYDTNALNFVQSLMKKLNLAIPVQLNPNNDYYYYN